MSAYGSAERQADIMLYRRLLPYDEEHLHIFQLVLN